MKYCAYCGKELFDEAVICVGCGCSAVEDQIRNEPTVDATTLLTKLSKRLNTNAVIWFVIGILQILCGIFFYWFLLIVGFLNIISSVVDMKNSIAFLENPKGIVKNFKPLTGAIIILIYNLVAGGIIGVAGSIYYFVALRNYVMENKRFFESIEV